MICRHCKNEYFDRAGRGLCRSCFDQPDVRKRYQPLPPNPGGRRRQTSAYYRPPEDGYSAGETLELFFQELTLGSDR